MDNDQKKKAKKSSDANMYLGLGAGLGAYAAVTTVTVGFTCPFCVVAAPALIGIGAIGKYKEKTAQNNVESDTVNNE